MQHKLVVGMTANPEFTAIVAIDKVISSMWREEGDVSLEIYKLEDVVSENLENLRCVHGDAPSGRMTFFGL
jgi:hypothetical protein